MGTARLGWVRMAIGSVDGQAELQPLWFTLGSLVERHAPTAHTAHGLASLPAAGFPAAPRIDRSWLVGGSISFCRPGLIAAPGVSRPLQEVSFDFTFFIFLIFLPLPSAGNHSRAREAQNKAFQRVGGGGEREGESNDAQPTSYRAPHTATGRGVRRQRRRF